MADLVVTTRPSFYAVLLLHSFAGIESLGTLQKALHVNIYLRSQFLGDSVCNSSLFFSAVLTEKIIHPQVFA